MKSSMVKLKPYFRLFSATTNPVSCWIVGKWSLRLQEQMRVTDTTKSQRFGRQSIYDCSTPLSRWYSMWKNKNIYILHQTHCLPLVFTKNVTPSVFYGPQDWTEREGIFSPKWTPSLLEQKGRKRKLVTAQNAGEVGVLNGLVCGWVIVSYKPS